MDFYKADLHIHTVLSPCGDLEMSPANIIKRAKVKGLDIIGVTDHNSTKNVKVIEKLAKESDILILKGVEITTKEEVHCLAFFENDDELVEFQNYLDKHILKIKNDTKKIGYQVVVDEFENVLEEIEWLLISALDKSIDEIEKKVHELNGLFIPAHIDRARYSILSQLGFISNDLKLDALELSKFASKDEFISRNTHLANYSFIQSSDAHFIENIGDAFVTFQMNDKTFGEISLALKSEQGRRIC